MPINWNLLDTQQPQKLAALFDPNAITMRNAEFQRNNLASLANEAGLMQNIDAMRQAPIIRQQQEQDRQFQMQERQRIAQERARQAEQQAAQMAQREEMMGQLTPEQQRLIRMGVPPDKVLIQEQPKPSDILAREKFEWEKRQPRGGGESVNWQTVTAADGSMVQVHPKTGEIRPLGIKGPAKADKPMTEFQGKSALFGARAAAASDILGKISPSMAGGAKTLQYWQNVPIAGRIANMTANSQEQKLAQAQRDFVNAILRLESGAAIGQDEFDNASEQYFPQPGDSKEVIAQKAQNRERAIAGLGKLAGTEGQDFITSQREIASPSNPVQNEDEDAIAWAKANPNDPRSARILQLQGR